MSSMMPLSEVSEYRVDTAAVFATFGSPKISYSGYLSKCYIYNIYKTVILKMTAASMSISGYPVQRKETTYHSVMHPDIAQICTFLYHV
jgi:hypothetical protein